MAATPAAAPVAHAAKKRADLVVSAAVTSETLLLPGAQFEVTDTVKNRGAGEATASTNGYFLSIDETAGGDIKLAGARKVKRLAARRASKGTATLTVPATVEPGSYQLFVCADATRKVAEANERNNCRSAGAIEIRAATDHDLIEQALEAGEIDAETALVYEVFADFGDPRLPAKFNGDDSLVSEGHALTEVFQNWSTYSPETQTLLAPFTIPPHHHGSWWDLSTSGRSATPTGSSRRQTVTSDEEYETRCNGAAPDALPNFTSWGHVDAVGGKVRVWYQERHATTDKPLAQQMATTIDSHIWPQLIDSLGFPEPLSDEGSSKPCRGGTDAYDISLVDIPRAHTYSIQCDNSWAGTLFDRGLTADDVPEVLAHEIFHAIQISYDVQNGGLCPGSEYGFWKEASAQWVEDKLYPDDDREHRFADRMLDKPWLSLDDPGGWPGDDRFYGEYLLPFFLSRTGRTGTVKQIWELTEKNSMLGALRAPFGAEWDQLWKDFAVHNYNRGEFNYYEQWDGLTERAETTVDDTLQKGEAKFPIRVDSVATKYFKLTPASGLTSLKFENQSTEVQGVGVQALIEYADGSWDKQDWSKEALVDLCLRDPEVKSITLVVSNSNTDVAIPDIDLKLTGQADLCCTGRKSSGGKIGSARGLRNALEQAAEAGCNVTGSIKFTETGPYSSEACCDFDYTFVFTVNMQMKPYPDGSPGYTDAGSSYTWDYSGSASGNSFDCSYTKSTTGSGGGPVESAAGTLTEVGDYNSEGKIADRRELLVGIVPNDFEFETSSTETYSGCANSSFNGTHTMPSGYDFTTDAFPEGDHCSTGNGNGFMRFVGPSPEATTLLLDCSEDRPDQDITRTLTGSVSIN